ncbi:ABC transporter ATP-binding protein [Tateyamaria pelophila]|uniref:ABC transporter ATP-binding protein n=1 Tax=Tateyamaria pelophila TaxID=328415 RepID=UPI001CBC8081|nr:ABC transporter ATP-binding protein [Tateyamaria pelophila]
MALVEIDGLRKLYGDVVALSDISITVPSGSFYTLLGPSGCGKTTLLRTIAGFHNQNAGQIRVDGTSIEGLPAYRRDVGMVFQDYAIFPHLSVYDNVAFGLKQRKVPSAEIKSRVGEVLEVVQLGAFEQRMPHELSGGQQQRVGLARAIVIKPKVLLMDEPLSNLDARLRVDLRAELRRIQQDLGITTIYVTHDQEEALAMSDTVCVMYGGVIQQAASPLDIYLRPANRFVATFVGANNFLGVDQNGADLTLRASGADLSDLLSSAQRPVAITSAIRPEAMHVQAGEAAASADRVAIPASIKEVSFIGREMEVFAITKSGEILKSVDRPDPAIIGLTPGSPVTLTAPRNEIIFFEDSETGERLT